MLAQAETLAREREILAEAKLENLEQQFQLKSQELLDLKAQAANTEARASEDMQKQQKTLAKLQAQVSFTPYFLFTKIKIFVLLCIDRYGNFVCFCMIVLFLTHHSYNSIILHRCVHVRYAMPCYYDIGSYCKRQSKLTWRAVLGKQLRENWNRCKLSSRSNSKVSRSYKISLSSGYIKSHSITCSTRQRVSCWYRWIEYSLVCHSRSAGMDGCIGETNTEG